ncbi:hypothetical protein V8E53_010671 [Lactarius tabidus]
MPPWGLMEEVFDQVNKVEIAIGLEKINRRDGTNKSNIGPSSHQDSITDIGLSSPFHAASEGPGHFESDELELTRWSRILADLAYVYIKVVEGADCETPLTLCDRHIERQSAGQSDTGRVSLELGRIDIRSHLGSPISRPQLLTAICGGANCANELLQYGVQALFTKTPILRIHAAYNKMPWNTVVRRGTSRRSRLSAPHGRILPTVAIQDVIFTLLACTANRAESAADHRGRISPRKGQLRVIGMYEPGGLEGIHGAVETGTVSNGEHEEVGRVHKDTAPIAFAHCTRQNGPSTIDDISPLGLMEESFDRVNKL